ncbi:G-protein coupled receptor 161-like [Ylistrum balloti]|uniref:G-protein coupled receptor 161-like n=1 Tax=Ylistrum balloti TaxID=509963 RepID=UPI00290587DD|nr:G-protein coupled receptor 161-like [Ylistrum balloti]
MTVPGRYSDGEVNYSFWGDIYNTSASFRETHATVWSTQGQGIVHGIFLLVFTVIGSAFNVFMIVAIVPNRRLRTVRNILLVHLGAIGLASSILTTLYAGVVSLCGYWIGGQIMCHAYGFLQSSFTLTSAWTIAALSWDKYQTIASPLHHSLTATARKMTSLFSVFWLSAFIMALPPLFGGNSYVFSPVTGTCFINHLDVLGRWYVGLLVSAMFYIPLIVMIYCYTHIFRIARTQSSRIAATMVRMACVVQAPIALNTQATAPLSTSIKGTKAMLTILQLVGAFTLTYIPFSIVILVETATGRRQVDPMLVSIVTTLFQAAPMTNSAIYGIRNKILRNSFIRYTRRKVQLFCYKDKRKGSVKRSSSFRMSLMQRKALHQNGSAQTGHLRRTQSLQVRHLSVPRSAIVKYESSENIRKTQSFTLQNGHAFTNEDEECCLAPTPSLNFDHVKSDILIMKKVSDTEKEKIMDDNDNEEDDIDDEEGDDEDDEDEDVNLDDGPV